MNACVHFFSCISALDLKIVHVLTFPYKRYFFQKYVHISVNFRFCACNNICTSRDLKTYVFVQLLQKLAWMSERKSSENAACNLSKQDLMFHIDTLTYFQSKCTQRLIFTGFVESACLFVSILFTFYFFFLSNR